MDIFKYLKRSINFIFRLPTDCSVFYGKSREFSRVLPAGLVRALKEWLRPNWYALTEPIRIRKNLTSFLGQEFPVSHKKIEIDITYECNLHCHFCDRFLDIYPSQERMSVAQIDKFVEESMRLGRRWEEIHLLGGEPMLHPQVLQIIATLKKYKDAFSPSTQISIFTNGCHNEKIKMFAPEIIVINSQKEIVDSVHVPITLAPIDFKEYDQAAFYNGCSVPVKCGMGLNMYGYYQCATAGALDRILGLDLGKKQLPGTKDSLIEQYKTFCQYCGHFIRHPRLIRRQLDKKQAVSPSWKTILKKYESCRGLLSRY